MKKLIMGLAIAALLFPSVAIAGGDKVDVCHAAGQADTTHYVTITVPATESGFPKGHFTENGTPEAGHEQDYLGACAPEPSVEPSFSSSPAPSPSVEPTTEPTASPEPSASATTTPSYSPSQEPTRAPSMTLPPTDTVGGGEPSVPNPLFPLTMIVLIATAALNVATIRNRS